MNFNEMFRVMVKQGQKFVGTGRTGDGGVTLEPNVIHQTFYMKEDADKLKASLENDGFEVKLKKGSK